MELYEFKATLVYRKSSRTTRAIIQRKPSRKNKIITTTYFPHWSPFFRIGLRDSPEGIIQS